MERVGCVFIFVGVVGKVWLVWFRGCGSVGDVRNGV